MPVAAARKDTSENLVSRCMEIAGAAEALLADATLRVRERIAGDSKLQKKIADRKVRIGKRHDEVWAKWQEESKKDWDASPITFSRLSMEIWDVIKDEDWVLTANELKHQVRKLWDFDKPYRHPCLLYTSDAADE